ncbi:uncharacterized protein F5891DRAFT_953738 [Suillus fuscotomentosus]|uniref:Uncharacterized protein n=1 Tax=Suillus fuscotomentosus TaxID=1912939 RepID=A0AAD4E4R5_9AGAM|nr:uncharacterized protein F5891DRAFT_953738 [Suillus fuscotomentosus]KAG1899557.1 hypothetical protein F5891DRAFT_953738 [Suillus fuscotomentosus]
MPLRTHPKVSLSKEARAALRFTQREKSRLFRDALNDAWSQIDQTTKTIAGSHHKSIRRVQNNLYFGRGMLRSRRVKPNLWNTFCWKKNQEKENSGLGKAALQSLVHDHKDEYHTLSKEEQDELLEEFANSRETKTMGLRISAKSKVNDITQTLKAVENELNSLKCRTGAETILYTTQGSTDLPLRGVSFATEGVQTFMGSVMGIDGQDLVSKMEGFAVQGIKGAAKNHQQRVSGLRSSIREIMNSKLQEVTGDDRAKMQWVHYFRNVIQRYQVVVEGWPNNIPFTNLSKVSSAIPDLEMLLRKWESGATYWKAIDDIEFERLRRERDEGLESGDIIDQRRRTRSDKGKKHRQPAGTQNGRKTVHKSAEFVDTDDEQDEPRLQSPEPHLQSPEPRLQSPEPRLQSPVAQPATSGSLPSTTPAPGFQFNALEFPFNPQFNLNAPSSSSIPPSFSSIPSSISMVLSSSSTMRLTSVLGHCSTRWS